MKMYRVMMSIPNMGRGIEDGVLVYVKTDKTEKDVEKFLMSKWLITDIGMVDVSEAWGYANVIADYTL